ncbi:TadE family protein [Marinobacterium weihaiense]|uniref:Pilus assembly protein n=1 Tax=Marinobacterium weihaiense TaxID=2851016 RepID=A0ABS6MB14_9GAMM|nr:TadE family protein [Marinobacterium weihaiense]MBV0933489.1 pilus assembly protein [Marinobacterium weihaiense]
MKPINSRFRQQGLTTVEFSLVGIVLFMVLFGLIEFGRLMFTWNVLDEATRRAARLAAVCPVSDESGGSQFARDKGAFGGDMLLNFSKDNIAIEYLSQTGTVLGPPIATEDTYYVRARVVNYSHQMIIPLVDIDPIAALDFSTTLPAESLGVHPVAADPDQDLCELK